MFKIEGSKDVSILLDRAISSHKEQWNKVDSIEDYIFRGKRPWNEEDLRKSAYSWCANFNYGKGKALVEKNVNQNVLAVIASLAFMDLTFKPFDEKKHKKQIYIFLQDERLRSKFSFALASSLAETLEWDSDFYTIVKTIETESFCFGYCPVTRDLFTYLGHAHKVREIAFEDRTTFADPRCWLCFDIFKAEFLYNKYQEFKSNEVELRTDREGNKFHVYESGWVREGLLEVFKDALNKEEKEGKKDEKEEPVNWQNIEDEINKLASPALIVNLNNVFIVKCYHINEDGDFCETYCATKTDPLQRNISNSIGTNKFLLYTKNHGKTRSDDLLNIVKDVGIAPQDTIATLRGHGKFIAEDSIRFDIKKCRIEDKLVFAGSPVFKETNSLQSISSKMGVAAGFTWVGEGLDINGQQFSFDLTQHLTSIGLDEQNFGRETAHIDPSIQGRLSSRPTNSEVQAQSAEVAKLKGARIPSKNADYAVLFKNIITDLVIKVFIGDKSKRAKDIFLNHLKDELSEEEITESDIKKIVKEISHIQLEPVNTDINAIKEALSIADSTESRRKLYRMYLMALGFSRKQANEFIKYQDYGTELAIAALENVSFYTSSEIAFGTYQDHITHLNTHFAKCDRVLEGIAQGEDIEAGFNFLVNCLTNTEKHVEALRGISFYKKKFKEFSSIQDHFEKKAQEVAALYKKVKQAIQANKEGQQQNGEQQQALDPKVQADIYNDRLKTVEKIRRTEEQSQATMQRKNKELEFRLSEQSKKTQSSIETQKEIANLRKDLELMKASTQAAAKQPQINGQS
jgi:hypothetical protein